MLWSEKAMQLAEETGDFEALRAAASSRSWSLFNSGRHWEAVLLARGVVELAERSGSTYELGRAQMGLGVVLGEDDPHGSMQAFLDAAETATQAGVRPLRWMNLANAAEAAADVGAWDVADRALAETEGLPGGAHEDGLVFTRSMLAAMRGDVDRARALLATLDPVENRWDSVQMSTWFLRSRAVVRLCAGESADALLDGVDALRREPSGSNAGTAAWVAVQAACAERDRIAIDAVLDDTHASRGRWFEAVRLTGRAASRALGDAGDAAEARATAADAMAASLDAWEELELPLDHALAVIAASWVLPPDGLPDAHLARARSTLESLGASGLLAQLDHATRRGQT